MTDQQHFAKFRFDVPDNSDPEERGLFAPPGAAKYGFERIELHDFHQSLDVVKGPAGLDVQGFTYINHRSALQNSDQWLTGKHVEETYIPECEDLVCKITGAKTAVANNVFFRQRTADKQADPTYVFKRGSELDQTLAKLPTSVNYVVGKSKDESLEPARMAHIDYSILGLRDSVRYCRKDIKAAGQAALDAEDAKAAEIPRYAAFSVWRPLKTVRRDPLSVCDWRTVDRNDMAHIKYRALSNVTDNGEYTMDGLIVKPQEKPGKQKWYWVPEQKPDEVLIIKFADTGAEKDSSIAEGCPHSSPELEGTEEEGPRNSIEVRVFAFW